MRYSLKLVLSILKASTAIFSSVYRSAFLSSVLFIRTGTTMKMPSTKIGTTLEEKIGIYKGNITLSADQELSMYLPLVRTQFVLRLANSNVVSV